MQRNFWFTILDDRSTLPIIDRVGVDHVLFETDYPHADSLWPTVQDTAVELFSGLTHRADPQDHPRERRGAVPPPAARRAAAP